MRNTKIKNLGKVIPPKIRLKVYEETLDLKRSGKQNKYGCSSLCLLIPCVLWDLKDYLGHAPDGEDWSYLRMIDSFPELKKWVTITIHELTVFTAEEGRIKTLEEAIETVKKLI